MSFCRALILGLAGFLLSETAARAAHATGEIFTVRGERFVGEIQIEAGTFKISGTNQESVLVPLTNFLRADFAATIGVTNPALVAAGVALTNTTSEPALSPTNGLIGTYYSRRDFTGPAVTRLDPQIDFDWGEASPAPGVVPDNFSVRWRGQIKAQYSEPYTFFTQTDDGSRLWVNEMLVINVWRADATTAASYPVTLVAGQTYSLRMEMFDAGEKASAKLLWSSPSTPMGLVPRSHLLSVPLAVGSSAPVAPRSGGTGVWLREGSRLSATVSQATGSSVTLEVPGQQLLLSTINVAAFWFQPLSPTLESRIQAGRPGVLLRSGDFMDGDFKEWAGDRLRMSSVLFGLRTFSTNEALAVVLRPIKKAPANFQVALIDGSILFASNLELAPEGITLKSSTLPSLRVEWSRIRQIERTSDLPKPAAVSRGTSPSPVTGS